MKINPSSKVQEMAETFKLKHRPERQAKVHATVASNLERVFNWDLLDPVTFAKEQY